MKYEEAFTSEIPRPLLCSFLPDKPDETRNFRQECHTIWKDCHLKPSVAKLPLREHSWFLISNSSSFFRKLEEVAFEDGLGCIRTTHERNRFLLEITGIHVESIKERILRVLEDPSTYCFMDERELKPRILESLQDLLLAKGRQAFSDSPHVLIQVVDSRIRVTGLHSARGSGKTGQELVRSVMEKIFFWIRQEGYDKYVECGCCCEERNTDQGASCAKGHFYCSIERCFETAVKSQIQNLRTRDAGLVCPDCSAPYEMKDIAPHLPTSTWEDVQNALVDKKVERQTGLLVKQFDERLEEKIQEWISKYGDADKQLKAKAEKEALRIRNYILNLSCPHCHTAYAEFSGCMALQCASCKNNFCGYCHGKFTTGQGTHEHVRQCLMNETATGSYYATQEQIEISQRKYRIRKLKNDIRQFKKDEQNAIVIELTPDLDDLGINRAALFEFGNLQGPEELV